jgi:hypothetical protein
VEPPGGESGNIEHTWVFKISLQAAVHPLTGPHTTTTTSSVNFSLHNKQQISYINKSPEMRSSSV